MASLTFRTVTAEAKASSGGQVSGVPLRIASKKFSRCGWWIALSRVTGMSQAES